MAFANPDRPDRTLGPTQIATTTAGFVADKRRRSGFALMSQRVLAMATISDPHSQKGVHDS